MRLPSENPIRRFSRWLGWSEDQYLSALGYLPFLAAYVAGVVLSYTSLVDLAGWLGFGQVEKPFFPFAIDALVAGCYVAQSRLAGLSGFGWHRIYIVALGGVAVVLTGSGNAYLLSSRDRSSAPASRSRTVGLAYPVVSGGTCCSRSNLK